MRICDSSFLSRFNTVMFRFKVSLDAWGVMLYTMGLLGVFDSARLLPEVC